MTRTLAAVLLAGAVALGSAQEPSYGGTLRIALNSEPVTLNPGASNSQVDFFVTAKIYESLIYIDENLEAVPGLASSWEGSEDGLTWTFHLQQNVQWHDGTPFTSHDVKFTIEDVWIPHQPLGRSQLAALESVTTPDDHTVVLHLSEPSTLLAPPFVALNAMTSQVLPRHLFENTDVPNNSVSFAPVGTGPFRFVEWVRGSHIVLARNENYWQEGKPYLDQIIISFMPDTSSRLLAFESGSIDYIPFGAPYSAVARLIENPNVNVIRFRDARYLMHGLAFNTLRAPFDDVRVRQAIAHAIDKDVIVENVSFGLDVVANSVHPSNSPFHNSDVPLYPLDRELAAAMLDEAGLTPGADGVRFSVTYLVDLGIGESAVKVAELIRDQLAQIGIRVTVVPMERAAFIETVYMQLDFAISSLFATMGPDPGVGAKWFVTLPAPTAFTNQTGYANPLVDEMFEQMALELDVAAQRELFLEIQDILMTDLPYIPIHEDSWPVLVNARFHNVGMDMFGGRADTLADAWLER